MAAILKLPEGKLDSILVEAARGEIVSAANLNSPPSFIRRCFITSGLRTPSCIVLPSGSIIRNCRAT